MPTLWDIAIEKCAGRGPSDKLRQRLFEKRYLSTIITSEPSPVFESFDRSERLTSEESRVLPAAFPTGGSAHLSKDSYLPRSISLINQAARGPTTHHARRSYISFELPSPDQDSKPKCAPKRSNRPGGRPDSLSSRSESESGESETGRPSFLYPVPRLPEMVGHGRFRRSKSATAEWTQENLRKSFDATSLDLTEGFEILQHNRQPFIIRKGSDVSAAMCITSTNECQVDSTFGSTTTRGFMSPSSCSTADTIRPPNSERSEEQGQQQAAHTTAAALTFPRLPGKLNRHPQRSNLSIAIQELQELIQPIPMTGVTRKQCLVRREDVVRALQASTHLQVEEAITDDEDDNNENKDGATALMQQHTQRKESSGQRPAVKMRKRAPIERGRRASSRIRKQQLQLFDQARRDVTIRDQLAEGQA
ncbi:MAG: hypothetical protein M1835_005870 [Candelina submexicana]|nr:MAG: hypothetical protein M1835_005870 [Candelina submexicana]